MILKKWEDIPAEMRNKEVRKYYNILQHKKVSLVIKRCIDILFSVILIILLSPIILILAILIKIDSKGPVFYRQERVTTYNKVFKIFKFRTMVNNADKKGTLITLENDQRITRVGKLIRKCRLDEIPQLFNVLVGDMSFVGTRPEVEKYVSKYTNEMKATLLMRAGITSYSSILYKDEDKIMDKYLELKENVDEIYINRILPEKMKYNLEYLKKFNIWEDFKLLINTALVVLKIKK